VIAKEIAVKKYVVKFSAEEQERLNTLIRSGSHIRLLATGDWREKRNLVAGANWITGIGEFLVDRAPDYSAV
jgi:hypothetical protein